MGLYIEELDRPRNACMRIHMGFGGEVWVFRGSGWESLGIKATDLDLVRCKECEHYNGHEEYCEIDHFARENGFCYSGKRRTDTDLHIQSIEQEEWYDWRDEQEYEDRWERRADEHTDKRD